MRPLLCLLAIAGCNTSEPAAQTRTITTVTWDSNHQQVSTTRVVPLGLPIIGGPPQGGYQADLSFDPVDPNSSCKTTDLIISDEALVVDAKGVVLGFERGNFLCLSPPPEAAAIGGTELVRLDQLTYPSGGTWAGKVRSFDSAQYTGAFITLGTSSCQGNFHDNETTNASPCEQTASQLQFIDQTSAPASCTASCSGGILGTCDEYGELQTQNCTGLGLDCSTTTLTCCLLPAASQCTPGALGEACGSASNACGTISCGCAGQGFCFKGICREVIIVPPPPHSLN